MCRDKIDRLKKIVFELYLLFYSPDVVSGAEVRRPRKPSKGVNKSDDSPQLRIVKGGKP